MYRSIIFATLFVFLLPVARKVLLLGIAFYFCTRTKLAKKLQIYALPHAKGQILDEARAGLINFFMDIAVLIGITKLGWIHLAKFSVLSMVVTYVTMFIWFEFWFYGTHRLYHQKAFYFVHAQHHKSRVTSVWTAFSFSIIERSSLNLGALGFAIVASHLMPFSVVGFVLYCVTTNLGNVLLHSNVEIFPAGFARNRYFRWIFTPTFHALHHARFREHYGLFTTIPDRLFGTMFADYPQIQERAARGNGLVNFNEKGVPEETSLPVPAAELAPALLSDSGAMPSAH